MRSYHQHDTDDLDAAAEAIASGGIVGFFFNGAYALLGDADRLDAAEAIFGLKQRPRERTLSLVTNPTYWGEFIDLDAPALTRFPFPSVCSLHDRLHALGVVYPARTGSAPPHLTQDATILNVWSRYQPLVTLQDGCRAKGLRALLGASANRSGEPTYTTRADMDRVFGSDLAVLFDTDPGVPIDRRNSVSLLDLAGEEPTLLREGNTTEAEVRHAVAAVGLGELAVPSSVTRL